MKKEIAQQLAGVLQNCWSLLDHTVWLMDHHGAEAEALQHRKAVGEVLGDLGVKLLFPIYGEYPELDTTSPMSSRDHAGQSSEKSQHGENHTDLPDPGDHKS